MLRGPRPLAPAALQLPEGMTALSPPELWSPGLSSPQLCPATTTYYASLYPQTAPLVVAPSSCLDATPHRPEGQVVRCVPAGRLPAKRKLDLEGIERPAVTEFRTPLGKCIPVDGLPSPKTPADAFLNFLVRTLAYVTYQDIRAVGTFKEQTVIAVKAPPQTRLEVPDRAEESLQIYLKSTQGPIEVYLCPEEVQEPDSPAKEPLPSTSTLSPSSDCAQPSSSTNPGISEPAVSSALALTPQQSLPPAAPSLVPLEATDSMLELPQPLLQQTEDQLLSPTLACSSPLISFSPPLDQEDYLWGLDGGEGISDLFDSYDLGDLLIN
ncbi:PREDICTED: transcription factor E2F2 [Dipodomys ordii]|uniref:Transcription factor E2F2 n=1 Tax=Dipodomys ordii TaxID=10020 RepID=A0A1S3GGR1_DIPOR|nr:PREDICTED: transcription factor E2F2 [Dipodomys ordii]